MAATYGLSADEVHSLMMRGRFRVKANVDRATADRYARELEALGARVCIEDVVGGARTSPPASARSQAGSAPAARPANGTGSRPTRPPAGSPDRPSGGLLQPLRDEIRDRAADPAACGPRHHMISPVPTIPGPAPALAELEGDGADAGSSVVRHRASWPSRAGGAVERRAPGAAEDAATLPRLSQASSPAPAWRPGATPPARAALSTPAAPVPTVMPPPPTSMLPAQPVRSQVASLPPQPPRPRVSALPAESSSEPASEEPEWSTQPASRPTLSTLSTLSPQPAQHASRSSLSTLPPQPASRPTRPSLPPQTASRPAPSSLPPHLASRPAPASLPAHLASRPAVPSLPPHTASRPARSSLVPVMTGMPAPAPMQLDDPPVELGALDRSGVLALATLDDEPAAPSGELAGGTARSVDTVKATPSAISADPFAPPRAVADDALVDLAEDDLEWTRKRMTAPPGSPPDPALAPAPSTPAVQDSRLPGGLAALSSAATSPALRQAANPSLTSPVLGPTPRREPGVPRTRLATHAHLVSSPRGRLVAGWLLAILLGFAPAHLVASWRERDAFHAIDARVTAAQAAVDSQASYDALDAFRAEQLEAKRGARNTIALTALAIWAAAGSAIALAWFRRSRDQASA